MRFFVGHGPFDWFFPGELGRAFRRGTGTRVGVFFAEVFGSVGLAPVFKICWVDRLIFTLEIGFFGNYS